eukprot:m.96410 g.96410  ORF g.96410 m.96410 type:complete len:812 (+) comp26894_c0_seq1:160-2595(+)
MKRGVAVVVFLVLFWFLCFGQYHLQDYTDQIRRENRWRRIQEFAAGRQAAATGNTFSGLFQPFPEVHPIGLPKQPACYNFSGYVRQLRCHSNAFTCREYECFQKCTQSFLAPIECTSNYDVNALPNQKDHCPRSLPICKEYHRGTELGTCQSRTPNTMCPKHAAACLPHGFCVPWARVEYQVVKESTPSIKVITRDKYLQVSNVSTSAIESIVYCETDSSEDEVLSQCKTNVAPLCLNVNSLFDESHSVCAPVYPPHHNSLSERWNHVSNVDTIDVPQATPNFNEVWEKLKNQIVLGTTGVCKTTQRLLMYLKPLLKHDKNSHDWVWECRPQRKRFYSLLRFHVGASTNIQEPILKNAGYDPVEIYGGIHPEGANVRLYITADANRYQEYLENEVRNTEIIINIHHAPDVLARINFSEATQNHVYHTCAGCLDTYCSKKGLCEIAEAAGFNGQIGPKCLLLPQGTGNNQGIHQMEADLKNSSSSGWAIKVDGANLHLGVGTKVVRNWDEYQHVRKTFFPDLWSSQANSFVAQEYVHPWLGDAHFHRKFEIRAYATVTSTNPLRVYVFKESFVLLAFSIFSDKPVPDGSPSWCMHDTHLFREGSDKCDDGGLTWANRTFAYERWCELNHIATAKCENLRKKYQEKIMRAVVASHTRVASHPMNRGITHSKARCFSLLRADITVDMNFEPHIMEINQDPYIPHTLKLEPLPTMVLREAFQELFAMLGVVAEWRATPSFTTFMKLTHFCDKHQCSGDEYLWLQRMEYEESQQFKFVRVFPSVGADVEKLRGLLPDDQQSFDRLLHLWLKEKTVK